MCSLSAGKAFRTLVHGSTFVKRDLHKRQKRPTQASKETYTPADKALRTLLHGSAFQCCQKRPTIVSKETY